MRATVLLPLLAAMTLLTGCAAGTGRLACPAITTFPPALERAAGDELAAPPDKPALRALMLGVQQDRARHRAECP